jgi:hypothetical protein
MFSTNDPELHDKILQYSVKGLANRLHAEHDNHGSFISPYRTTAQEGLGHKNDEATYQYPTKHIKAVGLAGLPLKRYLEPCAKYALWNLDGDFYMPVSCKQWSCPNCADKNKEDLEKRLRHSKIHEWRHKTHLTITMGESVDLKILTDWGHKLFTYLKRGGTFNYITHDGRSGSVRLRARLDLEYFKIKEFQPQRGLSGKGWVIHFHVIVNQNLSKFDVIPIWNHITGGFAYIEDTHPISFNDGKYLMKYLTKSEYQELFRKGERRYSSSKGIIPPKHRKIPDPSRPWILLSIEGARDLIKNPVDYSFLNQFSKYRRAVPIDLKKMKKLTEYELKCLGFEVDSIPISEVNSLW